MSKRKLWFVTRPERDPLTHREALIALQNATEHFSIIWRGNRVAHKRLEQELVNQGIKRDNISNDGSGGRTWAAMLKTYAYCYEDKSHKLLLTKVGKKIIDGEKILDNIKKQIITLQIPNAYFLSSNFRPKYENGFSIRPIRFLIKLCCDSNLEHYITKEEIVLFASTTKEDSQLHSTVDKIVEYRKSSVEEKRRVLNEFEQLFDHRGRTDSGARTLFTYQSDVANTFMILAEATDLVEFHRGNDANLSISEEKLPAVLEKLAYYDDRYPFNTRYMISLERMAENNGLDIDSYKASRMRGPKPVSRVSKALMLGKRLLHSQPVPGDLTDDEIVELLCTRMNQKDAASILPQLRSELTPSVLSQQFIEDYLNEANDRSFENRTGEILRRIGFEVVMRPTLKGRQTEIEILLKFQNNQCGIIDAKNYKEKFSLSAALASHMASEYIRNYHGYEGRDLQLFGYVTANRIGGVRNLRKISSLAEEYIGHKVPGIMINARTLLAYLDYCLDNNIPKEQRVLQFTELATNDSYEDFYTVMSAINN